MFVISFLFVSVWQYHGSFSLRHWLQQADWLPTLEATLALDEDSVRKVGDDSIGGPAVSRQLRIIRLLMRDLLIGVCHNILSCNAVVIFYLVGRFMIAVTCISGELFTQSWTCSYGTEA